jgi:LysM repeat protein
MFLRKQIFLFTLLAITVPLIANEFEVKSFEKIDNDLSARRFERRDVNNNSCAIIKIITDIPKPFAFDANLGIEGSIEYKENNEIWLYVSEGERQITIAKDEFVTLYYSIPEPAEVRSVYRLVLKAKDNKVFVVILSDPSDAEKYIDGKSVGTGISFKVEKGQRLLEVRKAEFKTYSQIIIVNEKRKLFQNIELVGIEPVTVTIKSSPSGASIIINDVDEGRTDKQLLKFPGEYSLSILKNNYETISQSIHVSESEGNTWKFNLVKSTGTLTLSTTPSDAEIVVNGERKTTKSLELSPGRYLVQIEREGWETETRTFTIKKGQLQTHSFTLTQKTGNLQVVVEPMEVKVTLKQGDREIDSWTGTEYKKGIPVGDYTIQFSLSGYDEQSRLITVSDGITNTLDIKLKAQIVASSQEGSDDISSIPTSDKIDYQVHYVRRGETLSVIARKYNVSLTKLVQANRTINRNRPSVGQKLNIPQPKNYIDSTKTKITSKSSPPASDYAKNTYTVKKGDTLGQIAENFNTSAKRIRHWNGLSYGTHLYVGQKLIVYTRKGK